MNHGRRKRTKSEPFKRLSLFDSQWSDVEFIALMESMLLIAYATLVSKIAPFGARCGPEATFGLNIVVLARRICKRPSNKLLLGPFAVTLLGPHSLLFLVGDPGGDTWEFFTDCIAVQIDRSAST